jgi:hypothetical protein
MGSPDSEAQAERAYINLVDLHLYKGVQTPGPLRTPLRTEGAQATVPPYLPPSTPSEAEGGPQRWFI